VFVPSSDRGASRDATGPFEGKIDRRTLLRRGALTTGALSVSSLLAACGGALSSNSASGSSGGGKSGDAKKIGFSFLYSEVPAAAALKKFANERAGQLGYTVLTDNIRGGKLDEQLASLDSFITRKVDALVVHVTDPSAYGAVQAKAKKANIPFFTYATAIKGSDGAVLFPFKPAAENLADDAIAWAKKNLGGQHAQILVLSYTGDPLGREASKILGQRIADAGLGNVVASQDALDQATGLRVTEDALKAHPGINIVMAWNDGGALGAAQALKKAGADPAETYVGSNEGTESAVQAMLKGNAYVKTINLLSLKRLGYGIVDLPKRYFASHTAGDLVVGRPVLHASDKAALQKALSEY
jgi:ABC-type sugar transport system substrate-binding protein